MVLNYTLDRERIHAMVDERVSQTAAREFAEDGTPLFDSVVVPSGEKGRIEDYMLDSLAALVLRNAQEAALGTDGDGNDIVTIAVPDFNGTLERKVYALADAFVADNCCALWTRRVLPDREAEYAAAAKAELDALAALVHTRKRPERK